MTREDWEERWEHMIEQGRLDELGPKGMEYFRENYGEEFEHTDEPYDTYHDYNDYEFDIEY
jgi:hypothetical protein